MCAAIKVPTEESIMTNQNDRNINQPQSNPTDSADQSKKNPYESGQQPKQQDSSKKDPGLVDDPRSRDKEGSEQGEKRRAS
jgi:hypothetical protein